MKQGKIAESVLKRSIFKQLHLKRPDVLLAAGIGEDCAAFAVAEDEVAVISADPVIWEDSLDGRCAVHANLNDLAAGGAEPVGLMLTALLPPEIEEAQMRQMVQMIAQECEPLQVQILGGHTEVTDAVKRPIISIAAVGKAKKGMLSYHRCKAGGRHCCDEMDRAWRRTAKLAHAQPRGEALLLQISSGI
ncbi:MAG: AIR synthase related protein [Eubacterium ramulus]